MPLGCFIDPSQLLLEAGNNLYITAHNNVKQELSVQKTWLLAKVDHFYKSIGGISLANTHRLLIANYCLFFDTVQDIHSPVLRQCAFFLFLFFFWKCI